jgi:hypothetical protein
MTHLLDLGLVLVFAIIAVSVGTFLWLRVNDDPRRSVGRGRRFVRPTPRARQRPFRIKSGRASEVEADGSPARPRTTCPILDSLRHHGGIAELGTATQYTTLV